MVFWLCGAFFGVLGFLFACLFFVLWCVFLVGFFHVCFSFVFSFVFSSVGLLNCGIPFLNHDMQQPNVSEKGSFDVCINHGGV